MLSASEVIGIGRKVGEIMAKTDTHPSGDVRFKAVDLAMKRARYEKDSLLEVLNAAQEAFGFLSEDLLIYISNHLHVPLSQIYGVATFYHLFSFEPLGEHNCVICTGTACHVKGSWEIVERLSALLDVKAGETTEDGFFSLTTARCLGSCGLAPVIVLDGEVGGKQTPQDAARRVQAIFEAENKATAAEPETT
jgi:bidirectional [NiFe] hydrogenase diaphorase subunit